MALTKEEKTKVIENSRRDEKDTGSVEVQVSILTEQIKKLTVHMTINKHDYSSKRGMDIKIARRKNLLNYLKKTDIEKYNALVAKLGLKK
jgi:small subunit ribosomal protein S15